MLARNLISLKQAEKILFIGKGVRILKNLKDINHQSYLPSKEILEQVQNLQLFDSFIFQNTIEKIRFQVATDLLDLIINKKNLQEHLELMKNMFFLTNGEFYQTLYEEARNLMLLPPTSNSENHLNNFVLPITLQRLKLEDNANLKNLSFKLRLEGFDYKNFLQIHGLSIVGNVR